MTTERMGASVANRPGGSALSYVWQPLEIGPTRVKNRIMMPARVMNYAKNGVMSDKHFAHYREVAMGGTALIVTEQHAAYPVAKGSFYEPCTAWEKRAIPGIEEFANTVHEFGCAGFVQLFGPGMQDKGTITEEWHPLWGVSRIPSTLHNETPLVMEQEHISEMIKGYGESALNVKIAGADGVEIHAAHGYHLGQFLSPAFNKRTDAYGGSIENRCRAVVEVAREVRERVSDDITVGVRLSFDEFLGELGITPEQTEQQLEIFVGTGLFDYFSISGGTYPTLHKAVPPMGTEEEGYMIPFAKRAKEIVGDRAKVFTVGRIRDLHLAEDAVSSGAADMVALSRAHLADPHLVNKTREGREQEIVKCVGINECLGRLFDQRGVVCAMNPATGRERQWGYGTLKPVSEENRKKIIVVGGGPAGMKTAEIAAKRGHEVLLLEKENELGGHFNLIKRLPTKDEWEIAIDDLSRAIRNAGVEVRLSTAATKELLQEESPDAIVVATGSRYDASGLSAYRPDRDGIPGADQENVIDIRAATLKAAEDATSLGDKVIIVDETASFLPLGLAELLARAAVEVEIVTPQMFVGQQLYGNLEMPYVYPRVKALGVRFTAQHFIESISDGTVQIYDVWGGGNASVEGVSTVVLSLYRIPNHDLYHEVFGSFPEVYRVGDCVAPRRHSAVIYEGEKLGREI